MRYAKSENTLLKKSLGRVGQESGISASSARTATKLLKLKPYKIPVVQALAPTDPLMLEVPENEALTGGVVASAGDQFTHVFPSIPCTYT